MQNKRMTIADLRAQKGKRQMTMLFVETPDEAAAASAAGIDLLSIIAPLWTPEMREAAGDCFVQVGLLYGELVTYEDYARAAFAGMKIGGDAFYCAGSLDTIAKLSAEGIPVIGHVGLIPSPDLLKQLLDVALKGKNSKPEHTFFTFLQAIIDQAASGLRINPKTGKAITKSTPKIYTTLQNKLIEFKKISK